MNFPIAIQLYSVRHELEADFEGTLRAVQQMGYDGVEFAGLYGRTYKEVKAMCDHIGLTPISAHVPLESMMVDPQMLLDYASIGCRYIVIPYLAEANRVGGAKYDETLTQIRKLGEEANKLGLVLCYHNHDFEFNQVDGECAYDRMFRDIPKELLQTQQDTCWVAIGGKDPINYIRKYAGRCPTIHLKDYKHPASGLPDACELCPLGEGCQNIPGILAAAEDSGTQWIIVEQDEPSDGDSPMVCIKKCIKFLRTLK